MAEQVFINCPFDTDYNEKFRGIVFTILYCGLTPRCALEIDDGTETRLAKIMRIVGECRLSLHDISRTQLDALHKLPRFNMPFELGLFFGAKNFGGKKHAAKVCLIVDEEQFRYQKFLSDISGQDIANHKNEREELIILLRDWLTRNGKQRRVPGYMPIITDLKRFESELPDICRRAGLNHDRLTYNDFVNIAKVWIAKKATV